MYDSWAKYYDLIYREMVDYRGDCDFLEAVFDTHAGHKVRRILDLGCGTGEHALRLSKRGYRVTGIDISKDLLNEARRKLSEEAVKVDLHLQDMRNLDVDSRFDAAICMFGAFGASSRTTSNGCTRELPRDTGPAQTPGYISIGQQWAQLAGSKEARLAVLRSSASYYARRAQYFDLLAQRSKLDRVTRRELDFVEWAFKTQARRRVRKVLDIACGGGRHMVGLAQRGYECTGQDLTPERVEVARARARRAGVRVTVHRGDATQLA